MYSICFINCSDKSPTNIILMWHFVYCVLFLQRILYFLEDFTTSNKFCCIIMNDLMTGLLNMVSPTRDGLNPNSLLTNAHRGLTLKWPLFYWKSFLSFVNIRLLLSSLLSPLQEMLNTLSFLEDGEMDLSISPFDEEKGVSGGSFIAFD